ncbi:hypothetical protein Goarm_003704, partial [Gossypium armourianum]|nr:hypothetical protein [Gossypium armourianum]
MRSFINGIPSINFPKRVNQLLTKDMVYTVMIKILGRSIGYVVLQNKVNALWKLIQPFKLMDIANGFFWPSFKILRILKEFFLKCGYVVDSISKASVIHVQKENFMGDWKKGEIQEERRGGDKGCCFMEQRLQKGSKILKVGGPILSFGSKDPGVLGRSKETHLLSGLDGGIPLQMSGLLLNRKKMEMWRALP